MHNRQSIIAIFSLLVLIALLAAFPARVSGQAGVNSQQSPDLAFDEAQTVYLINQQRRAEGLSPLRWNRQLTDAARWFAWDATANQPQNFCDHVDTMGRNPLERNAAYDYPGRAPAEIAICGLASPPSAVSTWMSSAPHRGILLDGDYRETGVGFYRAGNDGYVAQDFGDDSAYAPVVIENEAPGSTSPQVGLYIYPQRAVSGFALTADTVEMRIGSSACLDGDNWQPYQTETRWTLPSGSGWRDVYVQTRDNYGRTFTAADSIYLGGSPPQDEIGAAQMSDARPQVTVYGLENGPLPYVQLSLGWLADDADGTFQRLTGSGSRVTDSQALGGTAYRLGAANGAASTSAWIWTTNFIKNTPLIAYARVKIAKNSGAQEALRFGISAGGVDYAVSIRADQFKAANTYQEFALPFTFTDNPNNEFLILNFWKFGAADVTVDAVTFFTPPLPACAAMNWSVPGGSYRGQGVWARYSSADGSQFTAYSEKFTRPAALKLSMHSIVLLATPASGAQTFDIRVTQACGSLGWQVSSDAAWLSAAPLAGKAQASANPDGLALGRYTAALTFSALDGSVEPLVVNVRLEVVEQVFSTRLPVVIR